MQRCLRTLWRSDRPPQYSLEHQSDQCVLLSVVKETESVVAKAAPLAVKNKWPLIVSRCGGVASRRTLG